MTGSVWSMEPPDYLTLDFPGNQTLNVGLEWIEAHCVVPDGFQKGQPFELVGWQAFAIANFYRVKPKAPKDNQFLERPILAPAFHNRRAQIVLPQKAGKAPYTSAQVCLEAVGPALFAGWAQGGESWDCRDHGCGCGWVYEYEPGEAMGMAWPTPLIQITATSEEQTDNIYDALRPMIELGPLSEIITKTGEEFIRLPNDGRIDVVTSSATSRLGQRVTHVPQDETGVWTPENKMVKVAETQRRGLAGMGGRASETTNAWDPTIVSVAKRTAESKSKDIFRLHPLAPPDLKYKDKPDRRKIHAYVYTGSPWVDLDGIEGEALELLETDAAQAERFFGNRVVAGSGKAWSLTKWAELHRKGFVVPDGERIALGFDGSKFDDTTALIATHITTGLQWPLGIWAPADFESGEIDEQVVSAVLDDAWQRFDVWFLFADPPFWVDTVASWGGKYGTKKVKEWWTNRPRPMAQALQAYTDGMTSGTLGHDGNPIFAEHIGNAVRRDSATMRDDDGKFLWTIGKEAPKSPLKIDAAMAGCLSWDARNAAIAAGALKPKRNRTLSY